jgi:hypothetical protein
VTDDPRWEMLAEGRLSPAEVECLRADYPTKAGQALFELYRPFDADEQERLFEAVRATVRADAASR